MDTEKQCRIIGKIFAEMREARNVSQEAVGRRLLTQRAISNFEQKGEMPGWLVLSVLLQRLGRNADYFVPILSKGEYEYLSWRSEILRKMQNGSIKPEDWTSEIAQSGNIHSVLQRQFADFWKGYLSDDISMMESAVSLTITGNMDNISPDDCISTSELTYILICIEKKLKLYPEKWIEEEPVLKAILKYIDACYQEDERVKVFGKAVCLYGTYMQDAPSHEKLAYYEKALELHRQMANLSGLRCILRGLIQESEKLGITEIQEYKDYLWTLEEVKKEYGIQSENLVGEQISQEYYLLHEVLRTYRAERKLRVREIDDHVCSEKTYRALEKGKRRANKGTWQLLTEYMEIPFDIYNTEIVTDTYADLVLVEEIRRAAQREDSEERLRLLEKLELSLGEKRDLPQNRQYIDSVRDWELYFGGHITLEEYKKRVEQTIRLTIPEWTIDYDAHFYTRREMILVYHESVIYRIMGQPEMGIWLLEKMWNEIESSEVDKLYRIHEALLITMLWKDLLTDIGAYSKALEKVREGVSLCFTSGYGDVLGTFIFEPGWILERTYPEMSIEEKKDKVPGMF